MEMARRSKEEGDVSASLLEDSASDSPVSNIGPLIERLLTHLPRPGNVWPDAERKLWLSLIEGSFKLIYKDKDDVAGVAS
jgi:hypothetical protein